jgi:hypothetical protein
MAEPATNIVRMNGTRRRPEDGDIFFIKLPTGNYLFGRVRFSEPAREKAPMPGAYLIYIYREQFPEPIPDFSKLTPEQFLIPPVWTNRMPWEKGYFRHLENRPLESADIPLQHCFRDLHGKFVDEIGRALRWQTESCGEWGLVSYRWIDDHISDAVGIERIPNGK